MKYDKNMLIMIIIIVSILVAAYFYIGRNRVCMPQTGMCYIKF